MNNVVKILLAPIDTSIFKKRYWGAGHLHLSGVGAIRRKKLLNPEQVLKIAEASTATNLISFTDAKDKNLIRNERPLEKGMPISEISAALQGGHSIRIRFAQRLDRSILKLVVALERFIGLPMEACVLFITPPNQQALDAHVDRLHIFTLQIAGEKIWNFFDQTAWRTGQRRQTDTVNIEAGHLLYIPPFLPHRVVATNQFSFSLGIGFQGLTGQYVLKQWFDSKIKHLPESILNAEVGWNIIASSCKANALSDINNLVHHFANINSEATDDTYNQIKQKAVQYSHDSAARLSLLKPPVIKGPTLLRRKQTITAFAYLIPYKTMVVFSGHGQLELPSEVYPLANFICETPLPFRAKDLPGGLNLANRLNLLKKFLSAGILETVI